MARSLAAPLGPVLGPLFGFALSVASLLALPLVAPAVAAPTCLHNAGLAYGAFVTDAGARGTMLLWYPTIRHEVPQGRGTVRFSAALDAPPARGSFGIVLLSHGTGGQALSHHETAAHLARCGWVVAAVEHPAVGRRDPSALGKPRRWTDPPRHLARALDALLADRRLQDALDPDRIGVLGYGAGGTAALLLAGAGADPSRLEGHCREFPEDAFCGEGGGQGGGGERQATRILPRPDLRIGALVAVAPNGALFRDDDLRRVRVPVLLSTGGSGLEGDEADAGIQHVERIARLLPLAADIRQQTEAGPRTLVVAGLSPKDGGAGTEGAGLLYPALTERSAGEGSGNQATLRVEIAGFLSRSLPARPR